MKAGKWELDEDGYVWARTSKSRLVFAFVERRGGEWAWEAGRGVERAGGTMRTRARAMAMADAALRAMGVETE